MKRIRTLQQPTPGLAAYCTTAGSSLDWNRFRNYDGGAAYRELRDALVELQHRLCGYCEINLIENDIQVEHVIPQSDPKRGTAQALNHANLIASCRGGSAIEFGPDGWDDAARFGERSCGQAKDRNNSSDFMDPRNLPALPSLLRVQPDGAIAADSAACAATGFAESDVEETIAILGLQSERLRLARENRWNDLKQNWGDYFDDAGAVQAAAQQELLAGADGALPKFFTTSRSYFGPIGEPILAEPPQGWI